MTKYQVNLDMPVVSTRLPANEVMILDRLAKQAGLTRSMFVNKHLRKLIDAEQPKTKSKRKV